MDWMRFTGFWKRHPSIRGGVLLMGAVGLAGLMLLPNLPRFRPLPFIDSGVFLYIGWRWAQGQIPYLDLWDHKPPLVYMVNALGYSLTGGQAGVWLLEVAFVGTAFFFLSWALWRWTKNRWTVVALFPVFWASFMHTYLRNMTENYAILWQAGVVWLLSSPFWRKRHFFSLGLLSGLLLMTRPNVAVGSGLVLLYQLYRRSSLQKRVEGAFWWGGGVLALWFPLLIYFAFHHALKDFWEAVVVFNVAYRKMGTTTPWLVQAGRTLAYLPPWVVWTALVGITVVILGPGFPDIRENNKIPRSLGWMLAILLGVAIWAVLLPRRALVHYAMNLVPLFAIWGAVGLGFLFRSWIGKYRSLYAVILVGVSLFWLSPLAHLSLWALQPPSYPHIDYLNVVDYLNKHTAPNETVLVWSEARINFLAKRQLPTKYVVLPPSFAPNYSQHLNYFLSELEAHPPAFVVDTGKRGISFWDLWASYPDMRSRANRLRQQYEQVFAREVNHRVWYFYVLRSKEKGE